MALLDLFKKKETESPNVLPVLPEEIYKSGILDLQDVIAPHALRINSRALAPRGEKTPPLFFLLFFPPPPPPRARCSPPQKKGRRAHVFFFSPPKRETQRPPEKGGGFFSPAGVGCAG